MQKSAVLLYTSNGQPEKEIKKIILYVVIVIKDKILKTKFNQGYERIIHQKLSYIGKRRDTNVRTFCYHGLEELILLKYPKFPK
jgi:hypothetical protein